MPTPINVKIDTLEINPKNLNILYINLAQKSFFDTAFGKVLGGALSAAGGQAFQIALSILFGQKDSAELEELKNLVNQVNTMSAELEAVPMSTVQLLTKSNIENQLKGINEILSQEPDTLTDAQAHGLVNFLSAGVNATTYGNYISCIDNLLNITYGIGKKEMAEAAKAKKICTMGTKPESYAYVLNQKQLKQPIGIYDYVNQHMQLASKTAALVLGVCFTANQVYDYLDTRKDAFLAAFPALQPDTDKVLNYPAVIAEVSKIDSATFLPTLLGQTFATAPATLCGIAYDLVTRMNFNTLGKEWQDTNIKIYNDHGNIDTKDGYYGGWKTHESFYNTQDAYWVVSFANKTPSNKVNLAGRHGGFLGFTGDALNSYVDEIMDSHFNSYFDAHVKFTPVKPGYELKNCIWTMQVKEYNGNKVFMFNNELYPDVNLANNHGFLMTTCPGQYKASADNTDQFWNIALK